MNGLGPFWVPHHRRPNDYSIMQQMQPSVIKIQDGGPPDYEWARRNCPKALIVARDWSLGDQHSDMFRDPTGTGKHHAQEWDKRQKLLGFDRANTIVLGINEPWVWEPDGIAKTVTYTITFLEECRRLGLRAGALQLSVGWPGNSGKDMPPEWKPYEPILAAMKSGNHMLVLHEYWADKGPKGESWGWWAGRALKCPWDVPIVIGECGFEMAVKKPVTYDKRGWRAWISADAYADQLLEHHNAMVQDARIRGVCVFSHDYANNEWWTVDVHDAYPSILARKGKLAEVKPYAPTWSNGENKPAPSPPVTPPVVTPPAATSGPLRWPLDGLTVTQWFGQDPPAYARFGLRGHNGLDLSCVVGTPVHAVADGVVAWVDTDADYGQYVRIWHKALGVHSFYAHLSKQLVKAGDTVRQGDVIALSGNTGNSTGPHLHYELRPCDANGVYTETLPGYGKACDPVAFHAGIARGAASGGGSIYLPFVQR